MLADERPLETIDTKARRLLIAGRVKVRRVSPGRVVAECRGYHGLHWIRLRDSKWECNCLRPTPDCAHILAVRLVTTNRP